MKSQTNKLVLPSLLYNSRYMDLQKVRFGNCNLNNCLNQLNAFSSLVTYKFHAGNMQSGIWMPNVYTQTGIHAEFPLQVNN